MSKTAYMHRVFPPIAPTTKSLEMGPMVAQASPGFALRPPVLQRIPKPLQDMLEAEEKATRKRRRR